MIIVQHPTISIKTGIARISSNIQLADHNKTLWFEIEENYAELLTDDTVDSFFLAAFIMAIELGEDLHVEGNISSKLFYNSTHYLLPLLLHFFEKEKKINIAANQIKTFIKNACVGAITGFSGGIDSFSTYYSHSGSRVAPEYQITHFLYNNVGSYGAGPSNEIASLFKARHEALERYAKSEGKPFITVNSNLDDVINIAFVKTHTIRNSLVALLFQKTLSKYFYSSAYNIAETNMKKHDDLAYIEPILLPLLSTERMECISSGGEFLRVEKTHHVTAIKASETYLDVCVLPHLSPADYTNCGVCWKCLRTELTFQILGKLEHYDRAFPIKYFRKYEHLYLIKVLSSKDPLLKEIKQLIKKENYKVPIWVIILSKIIPNFLSHRIDYKISLLASGRSCKNAS